MQQALQGLQALLEPLDHRESQVMSDQQVQWALRALQGLKAHKVMSVLRDLRVQREQPDLSEQLDHKE